MKKAFAWNWVISGLIIGLVVITIFASMLNKVFIEDARQDADKQFSEIYTRTKTLCTASVAEEDFYNAEIPDIVEAIYISDSKDKDLPPDIEDKVKNKNTTYGNYLCMKLKDEKSKCKYVGCKVEMSYLGQEETVLSLADRIIKKSHYTRHPLDFSKDEELVHILREGSASLAHTIPPTANAGRNRTVKVGENTQFDCSKSSDPDGIIVSCYWSFADGATGYGRFKTHSFLHAGTYAVTLIVTDNDGFTDIDTVTVTVERLYI
ncbi:MAG: PKD domain-containing protein [archaeon]|nr:PKD domain-containing protein [archaeon]